jgi:hypothetical protein
MNGFIRVIRRFAGTASGYLGSIAASPKICCTSFGAQRASISTEHQSAQGIHHVSTD